jgi:hypothetical protein
LGVRVHLAAPGQEPLEIQVRVVADHALEKIEARLVSSGEDVRDTGTGDADRLGELGLADIFSDQKLLQTRVHNSKRFVYKSKKKNGRKQALQM